MALSFLQEAQLKSGLSTGQLDMKEEKRSPPLNNNTLSLFPHLQGSTPRPMALFSPEQILATQTAALMNTRLPPGLQATLAAAANSALYNQNQMALFAGWIPPPSPPKAPISPILKQSLKRTATSPTEPIKRPRKRGPKAKEEVPIQAPPSPPNSVSPEAPSKDTAPRDKVFTCGVCLRSFGYKHVLQNHERTHTGEKPFECPECHKRFTRDHHLKTHMRLHTGEKPYHCSHCDRQFVQVANLRRHLRVHTGERPYACELCSAKFSDSNQLKAHLLIHKGEKPFECEHCNVRFRRRHHLVHHKCGVAATAQDLLNSAHAQLASQRFAQARDRDRDREYVRERESVISDDFEDDLDEDLERKKIADLPINLSVPMELPEQTEPEDLSMSTGSMRGHSNSHSGGDSPLSRSPSSDIHDDDDEDIDDLNGRLFLSKQNLDMFRHRVNHSKSRV